MKKKKSIKNLFKKLTKKFSLQIYNKDTLEIVYSRPVSGLSVLLFFSTFVIIVALIIILLINYTPLRKIMPVYSEFITKKEFIENLIMIDSLTHELKIREQYFNNIKSILMGQEPIDYSKDSVDTSLIIIKSSFQDTGPLKDDSLFSKQYETEKKYSLKVFNQKHKETDISLINFYVPLKGIITNRFNIAANHYGVDIVGEPGDVIFSTLDGTVISATWTLETGYVIQVQHHNNLISVYKHNSELLKKVGTKVRAGEIIAVLGNSGELTTGPHLHFELWYNGNPVNPEKYIDF